MKSPSENDKPGQMQMDKNAACDTCGQFGAFHFGDRTLCPDCQQNFGACCAGCDEDDPATS